MKKYSGQAIAIIMVVLVVAAVIGASLYSRMIRNKGEVVDTRESQKALEQAGNVLDAFTTSDLPSLQNLLSQKLSGDDDGEIVLSDIGTIEAFLQELNGDRMSLGLLGFGESGSCSEPVVTITYAQASDGIEYGVGDVMAVNVDGVDIPEGCVATLTFYTAGSGDHLFTTKYVYMDDNRDVQPYKLEDMKLYCLNSTGSNCGDESVAPPDSIEGTLASGGNITLNVDQPNLYEFRILPLKEKVKIGLQGNAACNHLLDNYSIKSTVTCTGQERTMQVVIPNAMNMGYPSLFDYTIYNSSGTLTPYHPEP
jgi:hypothetical protein